MNRSTKFMYNTIASIFQQLVVFGVGMVLPRVMLQYYGSEINGITSSIRQFINYFALVEAGIGASAIYALYKPLAQENHISISSIVTAAKRFYIHSGFVFTGLIVILAVCFPLIRKTTMLSSVELCILVIALGAQGFLNFFLLSKYNVILTADQRSYVVFIAMSASNIISTIIIVWLAQLHINIAFVYSLSLISLMVQTLILYLYVQKRYGYLDFHAKPDNSAMKQRWDALYLQILGVVQSGAPVILATIFLGFKAVSVYSIYFMVIGGLNGLLSIFTSGLSASFGDVIARSEKSTLQKAYKEFEFTYYALITLVYTAAFLLIMPFVRIYTIGITDANYDVPILGYLMVINGYLYNLKTPQGMLVISAGLYKQTKWQTTIQALILVSVGAVLAPIWGLAGIMIGSILSNLYRDIDLLFFIPAEVTGLSPKLTIKRWSISFLEIIFILVPFIFLPLYAQSILAWVQSGLLIFCYSIVVIIVASVLFDKKEFIDSTTRTLKMFKIKT